MIYLILSAIPLSIGTSMLIQKEVGMFFGKKPFGYEVVPYSGRPVEISGWIWLSVGLLFMLDAVRTIVIGSAGISALFFLIILLLFPLTVTYIYKYATPKRDNPGE